MVKNDLIVFVENIWETSVSCICIIYIVCSYGNGEMLAQFCTNLGLVSVCSRFVQDIFSICIPNLYLHIWICLGKTGRMNETNKSCWLSSLCDQFKMCKAADLLKSWWLIMAATVWKRMEWAIMPHCVSQTLMKALWQWVFAHHDITCTEEQIRKHLNMFLFQLLFVKLYHCSQGFHLSCVWDGIF